VLLQAQFGALTNYTKQFCLKVDRHDLLRERCNSRRKVLYSTKSVIQRKVL
jgi:hypothetical protein